MGHDRKIIIAAILGMAICLSGTALLIGPINTQRIDLQLTANEEIVRNLSPEYALAYMALGAFRGLVINVCWIRLEQMKQDGQFWEAMQLSKTITTLQPRSPQVWTNRAWNMAYNISVMTHTARERWMWVRAGIELLRNEGIPNNPNSVLLYKELGWHFLHKIGMDSDDLHRYYKAKLAEEWHYLLGEPPAGSTEQVLAGFRPIAVMYDKYINTVQLTLAGRRELRKLLDDGEMKKDVEVFAELPALRMGIKAQTLYDKLRKSDPKRAAKLQPLLKEMEAQRSQTQRNPVDRMLEGEPEIAPLVHELAKLGYGKEKLNADLMDPLGRLLARAHSFSLALLSGKPEEDATNKKLLEIFAADPMPEPNAKLLAFLRARTLDEKYHMDPLWMLDLMEGRWFVHPDKVKELEARGEIPAIPIDWRNPGAQGLYWSALGVRKSQGIVSPEAFDLLNIDRQVMHGLQAQLHYGKLLYDPFGGPDGGYHRTLPDIRFIDAYHQAVMAAAYRIKSERVKGTTAIESFEAGHENLLIWAVQMLYFYGMTEKAEKYYGVLRDQFTKREAKNLMRYRKPLAQFVNDEFVDAEMTTDRDVILGYINGMLGQGIEHGLRANNPAVAKRFFDAARMMHKTYQKAQDERTLVAPDGVNRMALTPFEDMFSGALETYLSHPNVDLVTKAMIWKAVEEPWQRRVYDRIKPRLTAMAKGTNLDVEKAFPEPEGMALYREKNADKYKDNPEEKGPKALETERRSGQK